MLDRSLRRLAPLALLGLIAAGPARADCPIHPADLAPGTLGAEMPTPTWTVIGDGVVDVQDVLAALRTAVALQLAAWSQPSSANCPPVPGDIAPGTLDESFAPPRWTPTPDGVVNVNDVLALLRLAVVLQVLDPAFLRPTTSDANAADRVLVGTVVDSVSEAGLPGVLVSAFASGAPVGMASTDASGVFMMQGLPAGPLGLVVDGSTSTAPTGKFSTLELQVQSDSQGTTSLNSLSLPNEEDPDGAAGKFTGDESGTLTEEVDLSSDSGEVGLQTGPGGKVTIDDEPADGEVDLSVVPMDGDELPGELSDPDTGEGLDGTGEVAVGPAAGKFTAGSGAGLSGVAEPGFDLILPNRSMFALGTVLDIWRWDGALGHWVNHTLATGFDGEVVALDGGGTAVFAAGAATQGGLYAAALPIDLFCASSLMGRVVDGEGSPLAGVLVTTSHGAIAFTDAEGGFFFDVLPAYSGSEPFDCVGLGYEVTARGGVLLGGARTTVAVPTDLIVTGGFNDTGDIVLEVPDLGCLSGLVRKNGLPLSGPVGIDGPETGLLMADAQGRFFDPALPPGAYTAGFGFPGEELDRQFTFDIEARECRTVRLEVNEGSGSRRVDVLVLYDDDDDLFTPAPPAAGAIVELRGTDPGSSSGLMAVTGSNGRAIFEKVEGPFDVVAVLDLPLPDPFGEGREPGAPVPFARIGAGLGSNAMTAGQVAVYLRPPKCMHGSEGIFNTGTLEGTIDNLPTPAGDESLGVASLRRGRFDGAFPQGGLSPDGGFFAAPGFFEPFDLAVLRGLTDPPFTLREIGFLGPLELTESSLFVELDYADATPLLFDQLLPITVQNLASFENIHFVDLLARGPGGQGFVTNLVATTEDGPFPSQAPVPDLAAPAVQPWDLLLELASLPQFFPMQEQYCFVPLHAPLPASLDVALVVPPAFTEGAHPGGLSAADVLSMPVPLTTPWDGTRNGFNTLIYELSPNDPAPDEPSCTAFHLYFPLGEQTEALIPPTPLPFIFPDAQLELRLESLRTNALPASFDEIFTHSLDASLLGLIDASLPSCLASDYIPEEVNPDG